MEGTGVIADPTALRVFTPFMPEYLCSAAFTTCRHQECVTPAGSCDLVCMRQCLAGVVNSADSTNIFVATRFCNGKLTIGIQSGVCLLVMP